MLKRLAIRLMTDDLLGWSAQLSYYFFLALFPALICFVALASFFPIEHLNDIVLDVLTRLAPGDVRSLVQRQLSVIAESRSAGLLTFGIIGTVWSASAGMQTLIRTLNFAYHVPETRSWWRVRLRAMALTLVMPVFGLLALTIVLVGPVIGTHLAEALDVSRLFLWTWRVVHWPLVFLLVVSGLAFVYTVGPNAPQRWQCLIPGSCVATVMWIGASLGLRWYVASLAHYQRTYGTIGAALVILLWFYVSGFAMLFGAELNAVFNETQVAPPSPA
ncbi:MAG TPA: YihY/virulence factor BrkB family protein [Vicinamibacterales bacterium]|nr:YihY/virulence factor BrkB family protein [Vicinamibacterales bacterium]